MSRGLGDVYKRQVMELLHGTAYALETIGRMILMVTELLTKMIRNSQLNGGCYR